MNPILRPFIPVADAICQLLSPYAEAVIHNLETGTIAYISHNYSKRTVGDESLIEKTTEFPDVFPPYYKTNWDGRRLKSTSITIRNQSGLPVGLLCINYDISQFEICKSLIENIAALPISSIQTETLFKEDWREKISLYVQQYLTKNQLPRTSLSKENRKQLIKNLHEKGAFKAKKAADYVAEVLDVSRATIYQDLSQIKKENPHETIGF